MGRTGQILGLMMVTLCGILWVLAILERESQVSHNIRITSLLNTLGSGGINTIGRDRAETSPSESGGAALSGTEADQDEPPEREENVGPGSRRRDRWRTSPAHEEEGFTTFGIKQPEDMRPIDPNNIDFTLTTQTSPSRLWVLEHICMRWKGPIVVSVDVHGSTEEEKERYKKVVDGCPQATGIFVDDVPGWRKKDWEDPNSFPINILRNIAISHVKTSHYILTDVDLWPSRHLYRKLMRLSSPESKHSAAFQDPFNAFVIAAFELKKPQSEKAPAKPSELPKTLRQLRKCLRNKKCAIFQDKRSPGGHGSTNTTRWLEVQEPDELYEIKCIQSVRYEPYLVLHKGPPTPSYGEVFTGYGKNKIQHVVHLRMRGFKFWVVPEGFIAHYPHKRSDARKAWKDSGHMKRIEDYFSKFMDWVQKEKAAVEGRITPLCVPTQQKNKGGIETKWDRREEQQVVKKMNSVKAAATGRG